MSDAHTDLLPAKKAAKLIGKTNNWLVSTRSRRKDAPKGPPWYRIGGRIFYRQSELEDWINSCRGA